MYHLKYPISQDLSLSHFLPAVQPGSIWFRMFRILLIVAKISLVALRSSYHGGEIIKYVYHSFFILSRNSSISILWRQRYELLR